MEFNRRKFNIIVVFTVCLICVVFAFSAIDFSAIGNINNTIADSTVDDYDDEDILEEDTSEQGTLELAPTFTAKTKWQALNYALSNLNKYDYKMTLKQSVVGKAVGISGTQNIDKTLYRASGNYYSKVISKGIGPNFTDYVYTDAETSVIINKDKTGNVETNYNNYSSKYGLTPEMLAYDINPATATIDQFDYNHPIKRTQYVLTITLNSNACVNYLKSIEANAGSGSNPQFTAPIILTVRIDMKYGRIVSMVAKEKYDINQMGVRAKCDYTATYSFKYGDLSNEAELADIKSVLGK